MAWTPQYQLQNIRPVVDNILAAIIPNVHDALIWAAPPAPAPSDFRWIGRAVHVEPRYPYVSVLAVRSTAAPSADGQAADEEHQIIVEIGCTGSDPDALADELFVRVNAIDSILNEMTPQQWLTPIDATTGRKAALFNLKQSAHDYGGFARLNAQQMYEHVCRITITVAFREQ